MEEEMVIKIDASDRAIMEMRELLTYRLKDFMEENMTDERELIEILEEL